MKCPRCSSENRDGVRFCEQCGGRLELACPSCGAMGPPSRKFCGSCGQLVDTPSADGGSKFETPRHYTPPFLAEKILKSRDALAAERKQVTVLFADITGSLELIDGSDPEEARTFLDAAVETMMGAVHRYEGTVNNVLGDGIMSLFGAPIANEDHAVRACYAALTIQEAIGHFSVTMREQHGFEIQARVGIHSGEVVVRAIGNDLNLNYDAIGQTTHLAARMEQLAAPGTVRITAETLRLAEGFVDVRALGKVPVKGMTAPVEVFELVGGRHAQTRLKAATARGLTSFVGRKLELEALGAALDRAREGHGQIVSLVGEPGVGKSRLFHELSRSDLVRDCLVVQGNAVSYGKSTPYLPVIALLRDYFGIEDRDAEGRVTEKIIGKLANLDESLRAAGPALLSLLDVTPSDPEWRTLDPAQRRRRTIDAVKGLIIRESLVQPVVLVMEDLHSIDTESEAVLDSIVHSLPSARLALLINYRPEYRNEWSDRNEHTQLVIEPLAPKSADRLLDLLLGPDPDLIPLKQLLIERTEGNPLFLEESVRTLIETGTLAGEAGACRLTHAIEEIEMPATVQAILAARIDRLETSDKHLLQTAAIIGREVPFTLLQAIASMEEGDLRRGLANLQAGAFLYETRLFPDLEYSFRHALTHQTAYSSVLQQQRREVHARIVEVLERFEPDRLGEHIELLADHAVKGEVWDKAAVYLAQKAERSYLVYANEEAMDACSRALEIRNRLPDTADNRGARVALAVRLGGSHALLGQFAESVRLYKEALELAKSDGDDMAVAQIETRIGSAIFLQGDSAGAIAQLEQALGRARRIQDSTRMAIAYQNLGAVLITSGRLPDSIHNYRNALDLSEKLGNQRGVAVVLTMLSNAHLWAGSFDQALDYGRKALAIGEQMKDERRVAWASIMLGWRHMEIGALDEVAYQFGKASTLAEKVGDVQAQTWIRILNTVYAANLGKYDTGIAELRDVIRLGAQGGIFLPEISFGLTRLCEHLLRAKRIEEAVEACRQSMDVATRLSSRLNFGYTSMVLGEIYGTPGLRDLDRAEKCLAESLEAFEEVGAIQNLGRAHLARARLYSREGDRRAAAELDAARAIFARTGSQLYDREIGAIGSGLRVSV
ncbi:MAG: tetratricopeptide repeat protein [Alphaproteobacteria bacterium]|nr:tetratricopeptide repeat protein [Alphaproteobacteria bacterium]